MDPLLYGPGEGEHHNAGPAQIFIKATGEHTGGSFSLAESTLEPRFAGPPPHRHRDLAEATRSGPLTPDVFTRIASRYDFEFSQ